MLTKFGTCVASISLFVGTSNKEFKSVLGGKPVVLGDLLNRIGLFAAPSDQNSVCKKIALEKLQTVTNCTRNYKLFLHDHLRKCLIMSHGLLRRQEEKQNPKILTILFTSDLQRDLPLRPSVKSPLETKQNLNILPLRNPGNLYLKRMI